MATFLSRCSWLLRLCSSWWVTAFTCPQTPCTMALGWGRGRQGLACRRAWRPPSCHHPTQMGGWAPPLRVSSGPLCTRYVPGMGQVWGRQRSRHSPCPRKGLGLGQGWTRCLHPQALCACVWDWARGHQSVMPEGPGALPQLGPGVFAASQPSLPGPPPPGQEAHALRVGVHGGEEAPGILQLQLGEALPMARGGQQAPQCLQGHAAGEQRGHRASLPWQLIPALVHRAGQVSETGCGVPAGPGGRAPLKRGSKSPESAQWGGGGGWAGWRC